MNQYSNLFNFERNAILYAEASYVPRINTTNPYITALPTKRSVGELMNDCFRTPGLPSIDEFNKLSAEDKNTVLNNLQKTRLYLPYYYQIEETVDRALTESYDLRVTIPLRNGTNYVKNDENETTCQRMEIAEMSDAPTGFSLIGKSGCGKTTGINNVLRKYPRYIIHNPGTLQQHIQIPIVLVHMRENSNFHGLYTHIGKAIDKILGNTNKAYENELGSKKETLASRFDKLCNIIETLHIGMLIIDEIELIETKRIKEGTLETFMSLSNITGIAIGVIGTEDAYSKLFHQPRITRRIGNLINGDTYCDNIDHIRSILETLYTYLPNPVPLSPECVQAYVEKSNGIIAYIIKIFVEVAKVLAKGKIKEITPELICKVAKKVLSAKELYEMQSRESRIVTDENLAEETVRKLTGTEGKTMESPEIPKVDRMPSIANVVKVAIHAYPGCNYSDAEIETELRKVLKKVPEDNITAIISGTFIALKTKDEACKKRAVKKQEEKESIVNLEELEKNLPVSNKI